MQAIYDFIRYLRFTDGLSSSDIIGWILAALAGIVAYKLIDHMQTSIERHSMLSSVEDDVTKIFNSFTAISLNPGAELTSEGLNCNNRVMVRSVLHDFSDWQIIYDDSNAIECKIVDGQRYVHIRDDKHYNEWISTQALHEIELKVRRIEKMYKGGIVKRIDLADMFREIVPLALSGRLEFFRAYYGDYDAECTAYLVMQTIVSCEKYGNYDIVRDFCRYYEDHPEIHGVFLRSRRIRRVRDFIAVRRLKMIRNRE